VECEARNVISNWTPDADGAVKTIGYSPQYLFSLLAAAVEHIDALHAGNPLRRVWDNPEDARYDEVGEEEG
jgi:hypothetical protein